MLLKKSMSKIRNLREHTLCFDITTPSEQTNGDAANTLCKTAPTLSFLNTSARRLVTNQRDKCISLT